jgi:hypothetical protein
MINERDLAIRISNEFAAEGKQQSLTRAWFPNDAENYLEVLIVVAKELNIDIRFCSTAEEIENAICGKAFSGSTSLKGA